jgi:hypothetical protein
MVSLIGIFVTSVVIMDVYSVVYEQNNPTVTDELFLNGIGVALPGWGWDSSDIYKPINGEVSIEYSIELNTTSVSSSVGIYFIDVNDWESLSMVSDPNNYTLWLETNTDIWNGGIIKSRSSIRTVLTGKIEPSLDGEYMILGINVFQLFSYKVNVQYKINTWFNVVSITFVDIAKSSFAIMIPVATTLLIIDRIISLTQKEPKTETGKEKSNKKVK